MFLIAGITSWLVAAPASHTSPAPATPPHTGLIIGTPLSPSPFTKLYVLDFQQRPVPIGVPGELHISGAAAPCGALRPGLQGACFSANPFCEGPGSGSSSMLATGCVVRWLPAGGGDGLGPLELLGRLVSLAGYTVMQPL
jgi:non-ribosomal peptide synthetase component F